MFDKVFYEKAYKEIYEWYRQKYADRNSYLITDGIVDVENYAGILFLLKEAYVRERENGEWNLTQELAAYGPWGMWNHVAQWTYGLFNTDKTHIAPFVKLSKEERNAMLRKISVVNLKKVNGVSSSATEDLLQYTTENAEILRREVEHVQPRIIVCGGTFQFLKMLYNIEIEQSNDNWYYWLDLGDRKNILVLDYYHPAALYPGLMGYYGLTNIYQQALLENACQL